MSDAQNPATSTTGSKTQTTRRGLAVGSGDRMREAFSGPLEPARVATTPVAGTEVEALREEILALVQRYHALRHPRREFRPGIDAVAVSGADLDGREMRALVEASLELWLTAGPLALAFEQQFARAVGTRFSLLVNSGSSANLVAMSALTSPLLGDRRLVPGDEVLTVAAGFPTTVNPILQNGLVPVFVDVTLPTYNVDVDALEQGIGPRTRAICIAHTLGNPFDLARVVLLARKHDLFLIEDCCDALGATYQGRAVGTFGDLSTTSFFPAHHITTGEGGAVATSNPLFKRIAASLRDWGRDCWCQPGQDGTCGQRFGWQLGTLPAGYDHKYVFSHIGYNLKATELQAAVGLAQLPKLPDFVGRRNAHFEQLRAGLDDLQEFLVLPEATADSQPSWFGFPLSVRPEAPFTRAALVAALEARQVRTRPLFCGNLLRHPAYSGIPHRVVGSLASTDAILERTFWVGVQPSLTRAHLDHVIQSLTEAIQGFLLAPQR